MVKGNVRQRWNGSSFEYKISHIELLSEVRKNHVKSITLNLPLQPQRGVNPQPPTPMHTNLNTITKNLLDKCLKTRMGVSSRPGF